MIDKRGRRMVRERHEESNRKQVRGRHEEGNRIDKRKAIGKRKAGEIVSKCKQGNLLKMTGK